MSGVAHWKSVALLGLCSGIDTHPTQRINWWRRRGGGGCSKEQREGDGLRNYLGVTLNLSGNY